MMEPIVSIAIPSRGTGHTRHLAPTVTGAQWVDAASGCATADFTVHDPATSAALTQDCKVTLSDPRSGHVLWTGAVARNGVQLSPLGVSAVVRCVGNTDDFYSTRHWSLPYIVRDYSEWERETIKYRSATNWDTSTGARPVDPPWDSVVIGIRERANIYPGNGGRMAYLGHMGTDMYIGSFRAIIDHGTGQHPQESKGAPPYLVTTVGYGDQFYNGSFARLDWTTTSATRSGIAGVTAGFPAGPDPHTSPPNRVSDANYLVISTQFTDSVGYEVTNQNVWMAASYIVVTGQRLDRYGTNVRPTADEVDGLLRAGEVVEDLIGRCLRGVVDPDLSSVRMDTWRLNVADYREPTTPGEVMDDLLMVHPDHLWRAGKRSQLNGLAPLEWRLWDTAPRYLIDAGAAQVDLDGSPDPLYNSVTVQWRDWKGRPRSAPFRADPSVYPDIADLQGVREAPPIDLAGTLGEWDTIQRVGTMMLDQVARRFPAGTITVDSPVLDLFTQERVPPSQIEAGTTLALTTDEPLVVHRVQEVAHEGVDVAELTVGRPRLTLDQIVATRGRRRR